MAVPPDVIGGETITDEWGNDIRDWATVPLVLLSMQPSKWSVRLALIEHGRHVRTAHL